MLWTFPLVVLFLIFLFVLTLVNHTYRREKKTKEMLFPLLHVFFYIFYKMLLGVLVRFHGLLPCCTIFLERKLYLCVDIGLFGETIITIIGPYWVGIIVSLHNRNYWDLSTRMPKTTESLQLRGQQGRQNVGKGWVKFKKKCSL